MSDIIIPFGNLKLDYLRKKTVIDEAIQSVLESGWFILGEKVRAFEDAFADYCSTKYAVGVGSGTEALHLALISCGVQPGDEVITVANTCVPTVSAITFAGAHPLLVDIDPQTYTLDPTRIEERITEKTKVILPVHLYGQCAAMEHILDIAQRYGLKVIEDCAQAHGSKYKERMAGSMGDAGAYSFYPSKNLGAYGDAGMVVTNDPIIAAQVRMVRNYGEKQRYHHSIKGFNSRLDEMQSAILSAKLQTLDIDNNRRRKIATIYTECLCNIDGVVTPVEAFGRYHTYHQYVIRVEKRAAFQEFLKVRGITTLIHYPIPIHQQESYVECRDQARYLSITENIVPYIVSLPIYPELTEEQVSTILNTVELFFHK